MVWGQRRDILSRSMTYPKRGKFPKNIPNHDVFMGTLPSSRRGNASPFSVGSGGEGKTPPKAARIRHPKIPPLNYAARGRRVPVTRSNQETECPINKQYAALDRIAWGDYGGKGVRTKALPTFSKRMDETFSTPLADQQPNNKQNYVLKSRTKKLNQHQHSVK
ncbi:hypothetical protein TNCV_1047761 [Trichonephila clavipes]|nr:hypothetical protein TNCV_1047761 [Trichonephila clavipes]